MSNILDEKKIKFEGNCLKNNKFTITSPFWLNIYPKETLTVIKADSSISLGGVFSREYEHKHNEAGYEISA